MKGPAGCGIHSRGTRLWKKVLEHRIPGTPRSAAAVVVSDDFEGPGRWSAGHIWGLSGLCQLRQKDTPIVGGTFPRRGILGTKEKGKELSTSRQE